MILAAILMNLDLGAAMLPPTPLRVETQPAGAQVTLTLTNGGDPQTCVAPCVVRIRRDSPFRIAVALPGYRAVAYPPLHWRTGLIGNVLSPNPYRVVLEEVAASPP